MNTARFVSLCRVALVAVLPLLSCFTSAQNPQDFNSGLTPYQGFHGGDIDSVNMASGNVNLHIPLISFPQRGGALRLNFAINYNSTVVKRTYHCCGQQGYNIWTGVTGNPVSVQVAEDQYYGPLIHSVPDGQLLYNYYTVQSPDGTQHLMGYTYGYPLSVARVELRSLDATGLYLYIDDTTHYSTTYTVIDKSGIRYTNSSGSKREDPNGNYISTDQNGNTIDTLGRSVPRAPISTDSGTYTTGCQGPLPVTNAVLWALPGYGGATYNMKFCFASVHVIVQDDGAPGPPGSNGDGFGETATVIQSIVLPDATTGSFAGTTTAWVFEYNDVDNGGNCTGQPTNGDCYGSLTKITLPTGGSISYTYQLIGDAGIPGKVVQRAVAARTVYDGTSAETWNYSYTVPSYPSWVGTTIVTAPQQTYDLQPNESVHTIGNYGGFDFDSGFETDIAYYQGTQTHGTLLKTVHKAFAYTRNPYSGTPGYGPYRAGQVLSSDTTVLPNGKTSKRVYTYDNNQLFTVNDNTGGVCSYCTGYYGILTYLQEYGYGLSLLRSTATQNAQYFNSAYIADGSVTRNILDKPAWKAIYDGYGNLVAATLTQYDVSQVTTVSEQNLDPYPLDGSLRGNLSSSAQCLTISGGNCSAYQPASVYAENSDGNVKSKQDPTYIDGQTGGGNTPITTYAYGHQGVYLTQTTLPTTQAYGGGTVNHIVSADYDTNTGLMSWFKDQNNQQTTYGYDLSRRITSVSYPDGGQVSAHYYDYAPTPYLTTSTLINSSVGSMTKKVAFDGLGRTVHSALTSDPEGSGSDTVDTTYDAVGNVYSVSNPYRSTGDPTYGVTTYRYDALKRKVLEIPTDGSASSNNVQTTYSSDLVTVTDEAGKARTMQYDGLGRMIYVWEAGTTYKTDYQYDALSNLTQAQQEGGTGDQGQWRTRNFIYDPLSRLKQSYNPESGYRYFKYVRTDGANCSPQTASVCQRTDAIGNVTTYTFDALARPYQTSYSVQSPTVSTPSVTNYYDQTSYNGLTITYGTGRRTGMADNSGSGVAAWSYDQIGRTAQERKTIAAVTLPISYQYNLDGSLNQLTYPDATVEKYNYSTAGRELSVVDSSGSHNYGKNATYSAAGGLVSLLMANSAGYAGNTLTQSYNKRLQLGVTSAATPTQTIFSLTNDFQLGVTDNGNVWNITNNLDSTRSQAFTYDSLNRLSTAGTASTWGDSYVYDPWGNLYQMNVTRGSGQNLQQTIDPNTNRFLSGWTYDNNGNILAGAGATNSFDAENRLVAQSPGSFSFMYDGDGEKVRKSNGSVTTLYWRDPAGKALAETDGSGNPQQDYIYLNGVMIARSDVIHGHPRLDYYYMHDHLGTTRMITNPVGAVCYDADYFPYGSEQATPTNNCAQNYKFTGKERDSDLGIDDFGARWYLPTLARFLQPDWSGTPTAVPYADLTDPQTLNLYSYVRNNPLATVDADGHFADWDDPKRQPYDVDAGTTEAPAQEQVQQQAQNNPPVQGQTGQNPPQVDKNGNPTFSPPAPQPPPAHVTQTGLTVQPNGAVVYTYQVTDSTFKPVCCVSVQEHVQTTQSSVRGLTIQANPNYEYYRNGSFRDFVGPSGHVNANQNLHIEGKQTFSVNTVLGTFSLTTTIRQSTTIVNGNVNASATIVVP